jgi:oligogalacturonide lyase
LHIDSINSDETLAIGTRLDAVPRNQDEKIRHKRYPRLTSSMLSSAKYEAYQRRFEAKIPLIMFTMNLSNGKISEILHSSEWLNHLLFSPTDPRLLIYSHEGPWHLVDRIWEIRTDGSHKTLIHQRTVPMEIAGHEFWSGNGEQIWYDWQYPKGVSFYLASYDVHSGARQAYAILQDARSIHYNISRDGRLLAGDGRAGRPGRDGISRQWLILLRPHDRELNAPPIAPGYPSAGNLEKESLVNMEAHDYAYEPNVRFSPDGRLVIFRSNMFGPGFVFAVEVEKSKLDTLDVVSTPAIARRYRNRDRTTISP